MRHKLKFWNKRYSFYLGGDQPPVPWLERVRSAFGAFVGLTLVFVVAQYLKELTGIKEWLQQLRRYSP